MPPTSGVLDSDYGGDTNEYKSTSDFLAMQVRKLQACSRLAQYRFEAQLENFNEPQFRCANEGSENDDEKVLNLKSMVLPQSEVWQFGLAKLGIFKNEWPHHDPPPDQRHALRRQHTGCETFWDEGNQTCVYD